MNKLFFACLMLLACRNSKLVPVCGEVCAPNDDLATYSKGECKLGNWECESDGGLTCIGAVGPTPEICDSLDNDCDGVVDDSVPFTLCSTACGNGFQTCLSGVLSQCSAKQPVPETCDGIDSDCDGIIDNNLPIEFCYTGPPNTAGNGICHPGSVRCVGGQKLCYGEQLPEFEVCSLGIDSNCNGKLDGVLATDIDIVVIFDNSASMTNVGAAIQAAMATWINKSITQSGWKYALVTAPDNNYALYTSIPHLFQDFTDGPMFMAALNQQVGFLGSGDEPTLDAVNDLLLSTNPLHLSWRKGASMAVIVFSDEVPQSIVIPAIIQTDVESKLSSSVLVLNVFTNLDNDPAIKTEWASLVLAGHGQMFDIESGQAAMESDLTQIISNVNCGP